ncbi:MAG: methionyl-tRNA formyltransferase [Clostridia bacterium]|nr:methionyl-tRNA formyltransferase [Clostridia bacterium]
MMRILFMGTPEIAASCLEALLCDGQEVVGLVCQPDKPKGRGNVLTPPPTKVLAEAHGVPVYQPFTLKDEALLPVLEMLSPDLIIVVAYGKILPSYVLHYPKYGCINLHVSILPKYRGAAPMQRAIMAGETETGVTVIYMDEGMDTGDIIYTAKYPILPTDDYGAVSQKAAEIGAPLLISTINGLKEGNITRIPQNHDEATFAPKIDKSEYHIDFTKPAYLCDGLVRGLSPAPLAYAVDGKGRQLKICTAHPTEGQGVPGTVIFVSTQGEGEIRVACGEGALAITSLFPAGKSKMSAAAFLRGRGIAEGDILQ